MDYVPTAFFFAVKHEHADFLHDTLHKYDIGKYIMAAEVAKDGKHKETDGEHFHFYVHMLPKDYDSYAKRIITKFKLKAGRNHIVKGGTGRQYGKVKEIENHERMQIYTVKDKNLRTNMSEEEIDALKAQSFEKKSENDHFNKLMKFITDSMTNHEYMLLVDEIGDVSSIQKYIILFHIKEQSNRDVSRNTLDRYVRMWIMYHSGLSDVERCNLIRNLLSRY